MTLIKDILSMLSWKKTIIDSSLLFGIGSLISFIVAAGIFLYVTAPAETNVKNGQVLGEQEIPPLFRGNARLARSANNPGVYAIVGHLKHLIRNEEVFYSYDFNFQDVKIVSEAELSRYKLARLARDRETGRVYYLSYEKNLKKYHPTPATFAAYAGNSWSDVLDVNSIDLSYWEEAVLFKEAGDPRVYYITEDYKKSWVPSESEFNNAGFSWHKVITLNKADIDTYETVAYNINLVRNRRAEPNEDVERPPLNADAQLIITLDSSSPQATLFPYATANNLVAVLKLLATGSKVEINSLTLAKKGLLSTTDITQITIEDENGVTLGRDRRKTETAIEIKLENPLTIPLNQEKKLSILADFASSANNNLTISLGIKAESDIAGNATVSGIFPLYGATHKMAAITGLIGEAEMNSIEVNSVLRRVNIGSEQELISKFQLSEVSGNENIKITKLRLKNEGTAAESSVENITLYEGNNKILNAGKMVNNKITFDLSQKNIVAEKGEPVEIVIKADIIKEQDATLKFVVDEVNDVSIQGAKQGYSLIASSPNGWPVGRGSGNDYNKVVFNLRGIGLLAAELNASDKKIYKDESSALLGKFELRNTNQDIYLQRMNLKINKTGGAPDFDEDIIVKDATNKQVIATAPYERFAGGAIADFTLNNYKVGLEKTVNLEIIGDIPEDAVSGNTYQTVVAELIYKIGLDNTEYIFDNETAGDIMSVHAARIVLGKGSLTNSGTATAGDDNVELANFTISETTGDEGVKITGLAISLTAASDDVSYTAGFSDLELYAGGRITQTIAEPYSSSYSFSGLNFSVSANGSIILTIKADTETIAAAVGSRPRVIQFKIDAITAVGGTSGADIEIVNEGVISDSVTFE